MKFGQIAAVVAAMSTSVMTLGEPLPDVRRRRIPLGYGFRGQPFSARKDRTKVKAARKQNVQRQIQAKARRGR